MLAIVEMGLAALVGYVKTNLAFVVLSTVAFNHGKGTEPKQLSKGVHL